MQLYVDVRIIYSLIQAAADEQIPGTKIAATEASLAATLYFPTSLESDSGRGQNPGIQCARPLLITDPRGIVAGLAIYFYNYSTWAAAPGICLEELYVLPEYRRLGYARRLIEAMASEAQSHGCIKMEWVCLRNNERALRFYKSIGAEEMTGWTVLKMDQESISRLAGPAEARDS